MQAQRSDRVCLPVSWPIGLKQRAELRGTRWYVAWRTKRTGGLKFLCPPYQEARNLGERCERQQGRQELGLRHGPQR
jgi:hypothetical protein